MKPGRLTYWLKINDSFLKALVHYFGFVVIPILCLRRIPFTNRLSISCATLKMEIESDYQHYNAFSSNSWLSICSPLAFIFVIPVCVAIVRFIKTVSNSENVPKHLIKLQLGRLSFFFGLLITFILLFCTASDFVYVHDVIAMLPLCLGWLVSIPLLHARIVGLNAFIRRWHQNESGDDHSRLLLWKATMFKGQIVCEQLAYGLLAWVFISVDVVCFHAALRRARHIHSRLALSWCGALVVELPLLLFTLACIVVLLATLPILFSYLPPVSPPLSTHG